MNLVTGSLVLGGSFAVLALDVKNIHDIHDPGYLAFLVANYFSDSSIWYDTDEGSKGYIATSGVPQALVLNTLL